MGRMAIINYLVKNWALHFTPLNPPSPPGVGPIDCSIKEEVMQVWRS